MVLTCSHPLALWMLGFFWSLAVMTPFHVCPLQFTLAKPSDHVNSSQKENQPLTKTEVPNYGITDSPPPPRVESFPPSRLQRKSSRESSQDTAPEEPVAKVASDNDSYGRLSIGGESAEVYIWLPPVALLGRGWWRQVLPRCAINALLHKWR